MSAAPFRRARPRLPSYDLAYRAVPSPDAAPVRRRRVRAPSHRRRTMSRPSLTVAEALWRALEAEEVEYVFGIPGGNILPIYDAYARLAPRVIHVLVRHE